MYEPTPKDLETINNNFSYHAPKEGQKERYEELREMAKKFAVFLLENCPPSRERSLSLTNLEDSVMWGNASIARNE